MVDHQEAQVSTKGSEAALPDTQGSKAAPPEAPPQSDLELDLDNEEKRKRDTLQEMLFQEAEIIARNLKESGTRR